MSLKYQCLILDHDDTAVDSSAMVHYCAHVEVMRQLRPGHEIIDLNGWFLKNFHGIMNYLLQELKMSEEELQEEYAIWRNFVSSRMPQFYPRFKEALREYRRQGGLITVVSHSEEDIIRKHYGPFRPDIIFGWSVDEHKRKPSPWPVREILRTFHLSPGQALIVDDLKPGVVMGRTSGVAAAAAGWAHKIPEIEEYMRAHCIAYFETVEEFRDFIFQSA